jgi:hypothetical protein
LVLKIQSQIYNNGLFRIELSPEEEESLQGFVGLPNKVINHMQENCGTYFMVVFDAPDATADDATADDATADDAPAGEEQIASEEQNSESDGEYYEDDTWILRRALLYPTH